MRLPFPRTSAAISPTAHYTGRVWSRNGLSHPAFGTPEGLLLHTALRPVTTISDALGGPALDPFLLGRHARIDELLEQAIADGRVGQVVEVASGMSPRGWRFSERHGAVLDYVEADLPQMARRKRKALHDAGAAVRVVELDALADDGPSSMAALVRTLDPEKGLAIIAEGLVNYFDREQVEGMWARWAEALSLFPHGVHLSDLHLGGPDAGRVIHGFTALLGIFVRGQVHLHFDDDEDATRALRAAGFAEATAHHVDRLVRVLEARTAQR